jgi:pilus assembly protein Flp/PilA
MRFARGARQTAQWVVARLSIRTQRGATAVEYGLMVALIAAVIILAVFFLGKETSKIFSCTAEEIAAKTKPCP